MSSAHLLASFLLAAGMSVGVGSQTAQASGSVCDLETVTARDQVVPAFWIDEQGVLHGQDVSDQSEAPFNWNCLCG